MVTVIHTKQIYFYFFILSIAQTSYCPFIFELNNPIVEYCLLFRAFERWSLKCFGWWTRMNMQYAFNGKVFVLQSFPFHAHRIECNSFFNLILFLFLFLSVLLNRSAEHLLDYQQMHIYNRALISQTDTKSTLNENFKCTRPSQLHTRTWFFKWTFILLFLSPLAYHTTNFNSFSIPFPKFLFKFKRFSAIIFNFYLLNLWRVLLFTRHFS